MPICAAGTQHQAPGLSASRRWEPTGLDPYHLSCLSATRQHSATLSNRVSARASIAPPRSPLRAQGDYRFADGLHGGMPGNEVACLHGDTSDAQRRLQAGETFDLVIPATHWLIRSCRTHGLPTVGASFVLAYRSLLVLACYVLRLPADRSMHDAFWHSLMIRAGYGARGS